MKGTFLVIARKKPNQSPATSVDKKGTLYVVIVYQTCLSVSYHHNSPGTALKLATPAAEEVIVEEEEEAEGPNATVVAKLVTSHVLVPITRLEEVEATVGDFLRKLGMLHFITFSCCSLLQL